MDSFIMPSFAPAKDSASFLEWVGDRLYTTGTPDYERVARMAQETEELFASEKRLTGDPYHVHCFSASIIAVERGGVTDPDTLLACIGHDNREFVEEKMDRGVRSALFRLWQAESGLVEERYGFRVERLITANTAPLINHTRSSREAHRLFYARFPELAEDLAFFQVRGADRTHNMWTLTPKMGVRKIREKIQEVEDHYLLYANRHGIYVPELNHGIWMANQLLQPAAA